MNRRISLLATAFATLAILNSEHESSSMNLDKGVKAPEPDYKRKKCKSCKDCGSYCNPYNYKGKQLIRYSKPNYQACEKYQKK